MGFPGSFFGGGGSCTGLLEYKNMFKEVLHCKACFGPTKRTLHQPCYNVENTQSTIGLLYCKPGTNE